MMPAVMPISAPSIVLFQKDAPRPERRYRLCPTRPQEAEPSQETLELYAQAGWQFLRYWGTSCVSYFLFYSDDPAALENFKKRKAQYMAVDKEGRDVYLADSSYVLSMAQQDFPAIRFHFTSEF